MRHRAEVRALSWLITREQPVLVLRVDRERSCTSRHLWGLDELVGPKEVGVTGRTLDRQWKSAREAIGRPDVHLHDLRHTGLTLAARNSASTAELMRRAGHSSPMAALRYQHATMEGDGILADRLAGLAEGRNLVLVSEMGHAGARKGLGHRPIPAKTPPLRP